MSQVRLWVSTTESTIQGGLASVLGSWRGSLSLSGKSDFCLPARKSNNVNKGGTFESCHISLTSA